MSPASQIYAKITGPIVMVNEAKMGDSGLADTASAVRSGRLKRAEKVVVGNFEVQ